MAFPQATEFNNSLRDRVKRNGLTELVMRALGDGAPGTSGEIAIEIERPMPNVSAILAQLAQRGRVIRLERRVGVSYLYKSMEKRA